MPKEKVKLGETLLLPLSKKITVISGGETRADSVGKALGLVQTEYVTVHDGARPFVDLTVIKDNLSTALKNGSAVTAVRSKDTVAIGEEKEDKLIGKESVKIIQTPQTFITAKLKEAYAAAEDDEEFTDESGLYLKYIEKPYFSLGSYKNVKITYEEDLQPKYLTGTGFDCHRLTENRKFILGGVEIPHSKGLLGHSDADVLCHALSDAILSALSLPDIGCRFPDTDPAYLNADSLLLLKDVCLEVCKRNIGILNISAVVMAEKPKLNPYADKIKENLSKAVNIPKERIGLTFTTLEGLGFVGREEGIAVSATVILG